MKLREALQALADAIERDGDPAFAHLLIEARAALAEPVADEPVAQGLTTAQEPKYTVNSSAIVNRASGESIPADEPVFIFRARDNKALHALREYAGHITDANHRAAVTGRIADFQAFASSNPNRMKEPDTARNCDARPAAQEPVADEPVYGWYTPCKAPHWYSPVFVVGTEPPSPLTRERAVALGWIPVYTRPAAAPAERGEYPPLPRAAMTEAYQGCAVNWFTADQMRAYVDADRAQRVPRKMPPPDLSLDPPFPVDVEGAKP